MKIKDMKLRFWHKSFLSDGYDRLLDEALKFIFTGNEEPEIFYDGAKWINFNDVIVEQTTGIKDAHGIDVYEGDIVAEVLPTISDNELRKSRNIFEVKSGNYASGKWIAKEVNHGNFGVNNYLFTNEMLVIGNIHENAELLEGTE